MVEIETRSRIPIWRTFGWIQWHVIPEPRITLQGAATWWIHCHDSRATCHIAGCCHLANSMTSSQSHVSLCGVGLLPPVNSVLWSHSHIAGCKNSIRHIENRLCHILFSFVLSKQAVSLIKKNLTNAENDNSMNIQLYSPNGSLGFDERRLSYRLRYTCLKCVLCVSVYSIVHRNHIRTYFVIVGLCIKQIAQQTKLGRDRLQLRYVARRRNKVSVTYEMRCDDLSYPSAVCS